MMSFIEELAAKRRKLLEGIVANEGDIDLRIFEGFYPDEAHFIYELLQNAEDAGATEVSFDLNPVSCAFTHNGARHFTEEDIRAITGIFNSSKKNNPDKIGKFGVGFKSVFVYTDTPVVYSKKFSFRIVELVLPEAVPQIKGLGECTRFEFPFNNKKKTSQQAFAEVKAGLEQISDTTLLFLNNLRSIKWRIGHQEGTVMRHEHSDVHIEVRKNVNGSAILSSHWLRFSAPVDGLAVQKVSLAYELAFRDDVKKFDIEQPLSKQLKIVPARRGQVAVFFPAEKETSGLRFHLHAPFIPELSRASIKNSPDNLPLFDQLARLAAHSLHGIKSLGLLTGEFLAVLPNRNDQLPDRYKVIRQVIVREMENEPLTPTQESGHAPAKTLLEGSASLKKLFSNKDLEIILARQDSPTWVVGVMSHSRQDHFLTTLGIESWDGSHLANLLSACQPETIEAFRKLGGSPVMNWLSTKPDEWHQQLYAFLNHFLNNGYECHYESLQPANIVRLTNGDYSNAGNAYFSSGKNSSDAFLRVSESVLNFGKNKTQQADARMFLSKLGVREVGEVEEIALILKQRYSHESDEPPDDVYLADINRFLDFAERRPGELKMFEEAYIFKVDLADFVWCTASSVYLDEPFKSTGLWAYYLYLPHDKCDKWPLCDFYKENFSALLLSKLGAFAEAIGCTSTFSDFICEADCRKNPQWSYLYKVPGERNTSPVNIDFSTSPEICFLLKRDNEHFSRLVWKTMNLTPPKFHSARYQRNDAHGSHYADSAIIHILRKSEWIPLKDGRFVSPADASRDELLPGFAFDSNFKWLEAVKFGESKIKEVAEHSAQSQKRAELAKKRAELGFETEDALERAQAFNKLPKDEQERFLAESRRRSMEPEEEFPARPIRNKALRNQRVADQAALTPNKETQMRMRSVPVGSDAAKSEAKLYLQEQYTNENGVMFCQACKAALPFRLPNGAHYFEAIAAVEGLSKRLRVTFLALCPNHAAMFQYANEQTDSMQELLETAVGREVELTLGGAVTTILFTEVHIADIKACLESADVPDADSR